MFTTDSERIYSSKWRGEDIISCCQGLSSKFLAEELLPESNQTFKSFPEEWYNINTFEVTQIRLRFWLRTHLSMKSRHCALILLPRNAALKPEAALRKNIILLEFISLIADDDSNSIQLYSTSSVSPCHSQSTTNLQQKPRSTDLHGASDQGPEL